MLDFGGWPIWLTVIRRLLTVLVMAGLGLHAYVQYRRGGRQMLTPERWLFLLFSAVFLFASVANLVAATLAVQYHSRRGPLNFGIFSLLLFVVYFVFAHRAYRRERF